MNFSFTFLTLKAKKIAEFYAAGSVLFSPLPNILILLSLKFQLKIRKRN